jgi:hypothetical protein
VASQILGSPYASVANPHQGEIVIQDTSGIGKAGIFYAYDGTNWNSFGGGARPTTSPAKQQIIPYCQRMTWYWAIPPALHLL